MVFFVNGVPGWTGSHSPNKNTSPPGAMLEPFLHFLHILRRKGLGKLCTLSFPGRGVVLTCICEADEIVQSGEIGFGVALLFGAYICCFGESAVVVVLECLRTVCRS